MSNYIFTSESVSIGHPDKVADQISDAVLDAVTAQDSNARVACETFLAGDLVVLGGEISSSAQVDFEAIARKTIKEIGYVDEAYGLSAEHARVTVNINHQSPEIAGGVFNSLEARQGASDPYDIQGAGDQGIVFGYAVNDNTDYFPVAAKLAHMLSAKHVELRRGGNSPLRPDAKTQVSIRYENGKPVSIENVLVSTQHDTNANLKTLQNYVSEYLISPVIAEYNEQYSLRVALRDEHNYLINPAGEWHVGGSAADAGLTGRKIIVDSYCGYARHGGGAFSGKDSSKTDRSGAYMLRYVAKNLVAAGLADEVELQVAYAIGSSHPVSIHVDTRGTNHVPEEQIVKFCADNFDFRPAAIVDALQLKETGFWQLTAENGHFGRNPGGKFRWENIK